jgi:hypothetical protein
MARSSTPMSTTVPAVLKETMDSSGMIHCSSKAETPKDYGLLVTGPLRTASELVNEGLCTSVTCIPVTGTGILALTRNKEG